MSHDGTLCEAREIEVLKGGTGWRLARGRAVVTGTVLDVVHVVGWQPLFGSLHYCNS
jgi:hypothetical protein